MPGKLSLLPNVLAEEADILQFVPARLANVVITLDGLIVENEKEARKFLKRFVFPEGRSFRDIPLRVLNKHTKSSEIKELLDPVVKGEHWGVISDAGLPCIADPGSSVVAAAHKKKIQIEAISGPSSIVLALMLSGLSGQRFFFHGYLQRGKEPLSSELKALEKESIEREATQIFIEAPHRSMQMFETLISSLSLTTLLSIASNLTGEDEFIKTLSIQKWQEEKEINLHKKPTIFLLSAKLN